MPSMALRKAMWMERARTFPFFVLGVLVAASIGVLLAANPAQAATFTVNSTADTPDANLANTVCDVNASVSGNQCTLRAAIQEANNTSGADVIPFNIPDNPNVAGLEVKTISPASALPIIRQAVTINGYTQSGASLNTRVTGNNAVLKVQLNGTNAGTNADGLAITSSNSIIQGLVINRFKGNKHSAGNGVLISGTGATGNRVRGNFIGTNANGTGALGNNSRGVEISNGAANNTVGGTASGARNVISGNVGSGVSILGTGATGNKVEGNFIGTTRPGTAALANSTGVLISNAPNTTVGGTVAGARNVISGNQGDGVQINSAGATGNKVEGNFIGTTANGTGDLGNGSDGVSIFIAFTNTVGGTVAGARNVISGNVGDGVRINISGDTGNRVQGNFIGTDKTGTADLGNDGSGVAIFSGVNNTVGGTEAGARNVISGNGSDGVAIEGSESTGNKVEGNFIGTDKSGSSDLSNGFGGVFIQDATNNTVGGTTREAGNRIAHNGDDGVEIVGGVGNRILSNLIFTNAGLGINLGANGVTANDDDDTDTGSNNLQNFPVIDSATQAPILPFGFGITITGTLISNPNQDFTVQCFLAEDPADASGHGEGQGFVAEDTEVRTDTNGEASFECKFFFTLTLVGRQVSTTATNEATGDTSEFSANFPISNP